MGTKMQQRRGTAAEWTAANPVLSDGEIGVARDTGVVKIGDGVKTWTALGAILGSTYLPLLGKAADSDKLDGLDSTAFLQTTTAASTYLTQTNAASTYLTQANAATNYVTEAETSVAATVNNVVRRSATGTITIANGTVSTDAAAFGQLSSFGRDMGTGTTWPASGNRRGDVYYHTSYSQLGIHDGTVWRLADVGRVASVAARDALPYSYAGMRILDTSTGIVWEYQNTFLGWTRQWDLPWGELSSTTISTSNVVGTYAEFGAAVVAIPKGRKIRIEGLTNWYTASSVKTTIRTQIRIHRDAAATPTTLVLNGTEYDRRIGGPSGMDLADTVYDVPYTTAGTLGGSVNTRYSLWAVWTAATPDNGLFATSSSLEQNFISLVDVGPATAPPTV